MKQFLLILIVIVTFAACVNNENSTIDGVSRTTNNNTSNPTSSSDYNINYIYGNVSWIMYDDAQALIENRIDGIEMPAERERLIFIGTVTDITFQIYDKTASYDTGEVHKELYTIYDIDIKKAYKGDITDKVQIEIMGGISGKYVEEQVEQLKKYNIHDVKQISTIELMIGDTHLFAVSKIDDTPAFISHPSQSIFDIKKPYAKPAGISAQDVISYFGEDKWKEFLEIWG